MSYQIVFWSTIVWIAVGVAPYVYALNDLITWR
jgi:hypothetical protein